MIAAAGGFAFVHGAALALLALLPVLWWAARRRPPVLLFAPAPLGRRGEFGAALPQTWRTRLTWLPDVLELLGLAALIVALARPVVRTPIPQTRPGIDIFLCLDVSSSMADTDMAQGQDRLSVAKQAAARFSLARGNDRIGLVTFARFPELLCPLTLDHAALRRLLANTSMVERDGAEDATGIGTALARTVQVLRASDSKTKVIVLVTDGEENVATAQTPEEIGPVPAAQLARELGVRVYTIALGSGVAVAAANGGRSVPIDTRQVQQVAQMTGGAFFKARDAQAIEQVYARIDALETGPVPEPEFRVDEWFGFAVVGALCAAAAAWLLRAVGLQVLP